MRLALAALAVAVAPLILIGAACMGSTSSPSAPQTTPVRAVPSISSRPTTPAVPEPSSIPATLPSLAVSPTPDPFATPESAAQRFVVEYVTRPVGDTESARLSRIDVMTDHERARFGQYASDRPATTDAQAHSQLQLVNEGRDANGHIGILITEEVQVIDNGTPHMTQAHFELTMVQVGTRWLVDEARVS